MITLTNAALSVDVIHPEEDRDRLGPRFCTGGYVYQVRDAERGDLLSGPEYPRERPSVINGQGMPDVFQHTLFNDAEDIPDRRLVIGVGLLENSARLRADQSHFNSAVEEFCAWEIRTSPDFIAMRATQALHPWALDVTRVVKLKERTVTIETGLSNRGAVPLPYRWFAHPFFPVPPGLQCGIFPRGYRVDPNPGFRMEEGGRLMMNSGADWATGHFVLVRCEGPDEELRVRQHHGTIGTVDVRCSFRPARLALWANDRTFSFEPFVQGSLDRAGSVRWEMSYRFGGGE